MAACELSVEQIYAFFKENSGKVKNRDAVRYFKRYLTDPTSKDENRTKFKQYVNLLAHTKNEEGEKVLILKTKYQNSLDVAPSPLASPLGHQEGRFAPSGNMTSPQFDPWNAVGIPATPLTEINSNVVPPLNFGVSPVSAPSRSSPARQPPPYRYPPPAPMSPSNSSLDTISLGSTSTLNSLAFSEPTRGEDAPPQAPPRRRDSEKSRSFGVEDNKGNEANQDATTTPISVRERTQKFNRMASTEEESAAKMPKSAEKDRNRSGNWGTDEQDTPNLPPLEPKKCQEWYVTCSRGDCQELLKLARTEPRLVNRKDPFSTVLHWGAKYGNPEIIKIFAGKYRCDVNAKTNGGYTPLHISAQFGHKNLFKLLIEVYKADTKIRDYSGRTAEYYLLTKEQQKENYGPTIRRIKGRKKQSEKDLGFLRIGSLNVRVKKTTEAFSNFLGVGSSASIIPAETIHEKVHKGWGSADTLIKDPNLTGAKSTYLSRKKSKRAVDSGLASSTPNTPQTPTRSLSLAGTTCQNDSDSDSAGFDSNWKN